MNKPDPDNCPQTQAEWLALARDVLDVEIQGLEAVRERMGPSFVRAMSLLADCKGRVAVTGVGKSGLVARKIAATLSSTGTPAFFLHPVEGLHGDMGMLQSNDVVLALSNSGETDELTAIIPALKTLGASVIVLTGRANSSLARLAHEVIDCGVPREACGLNLAPTASTTAALAVGDALAVCLMRCKHFDEADFLRNHPAGSLGQRLRAPVSSIMHRLDSPGMPVVQESATYGRALEVLNKGGLGTVLVTDAQGRLTGIVTDGDVRRTVCGGGANPEAPVTEYMIASPQSAQPGQSVAELLDIMENKAIMVLPVVEGDGVLVGVAHLHDLLGKGLLRFAG